MPPQRELIKIKPLKKSRVTNGMTWWTHIWWNNTIKFSKLAVLRTEPCLRNWSSEDKRGILSTGTQIREIGVSNWRLPSHQKFPSEGEQGILMISEAFAKAETPLLNSSELFTYNKPWPFSEWRYKMLLSSHVYTNLIGTNLQFCREGVVYWLFCK